MVKMTFVNDGKSTAVKRNALFEDSWKGMSALAFFFLTTALSRMVTNKSCFGRCTKSSTFSFFFFGVA